MSTITPNEADQIRRANASGLPPAVFVHGLWLLAGSWDPWRRRFEDSGYATVAADWPGDLPTVEEARAAPESVAGTHIEDVVDHLLEVLDALDSTPLLVGHSFGGLIVQALAGSGAAAATVAIDPAPYRGVLPLPWAALRSSAPVLARPANLGRAKSLTLEQFGYAWANNLTADEARDLFQRHHVPAPCAPVFQAATANLNPWTGARVDTRNPARGPLLLVAGGNDHTVPARIVTAMYRRQARNPGLTELRDAPGRGHSLTIDHGWSGVATIALDFFERVRSTSTEVRP